MRYLRIRSALAVGAVVAVATKILLAESASAATPAPQYDISTLPGKVASVNGTAWLQIRFSGTARSRTVYASGRPRARRARPAR